MLKTRLLHQSLILLAASVQGLGEWLALARSRWADVWRERLTHR